MKLFSFSFLALLVAIGFSSCLKQKYTAPPEDAALTWDTVLPTNTTLKFITQSCLALNSSVGSRQMGDTTISGVVVGDDRTGNLYKMIIIEDTLGGAIELYVDKSYLYNDFPVGRKVYVKLKGLFLVNYNGTPEVCYNAVGSTTTAIPSALIDTFIVKAKIKDTSVKAKVLTIEQLNSSYSNYICNLVTITGAQFTSNFIDSPYSWPKSSGVNRNVENCAHNSIIMRTSGYANFQPAILPRGNGVITAILTAYKTTPQLLLRDTADVQFTGSRCN